MAQQFSKTDQKRISFLSAFAAIVGTAEGVDEAYDATAEVISRLEEDGFFTSEGGSSRRSTGSGRKGSSSRSSGKGRGGGGRGGKLQGEITERQIDKIIELSDGDYSEEDLEGFSKQEASDLIQDLMGDS
jgi:hypothetical protein